MFSNAEANYSMTYNQAYRFLEFKYHKRVYFNFLVRFNILLCSWIKIQKMFAIVLNLKHYTFIMNFDNEYESTNLYGFNNP